MPCAPYPLSEAPDTSVASTDLQEDLTFLREEEKLARDLYLRMYEAWGSTVHANIATSEQSHMDSVKTMLDAYDIADPASDDVAGQFQSVELADLYAQLVAKGLVSETESLVVGAIIEDLDIRHLEEMKGRTDASDVFGVYNSLQCGSRNHLRSFISNLQQKGETFTPQYIPQRSAVGFPGRRAETRSARGRSAGKRGPVVGNEVRQTIDRAVRRARSPAFQNP